MELHKIIGQYIHFVCINPPGTLYVNTLENLSGWSKELLLLKK